MLHFRQKYGYSFKFHGIFTKIFKSSLHVYLIFHNNLIIIFKILYREKEKIPQIV